MNNDYEEILDWWSSLPLEEQYDLKIKHIGNSVSVGGLNEAHITQIYRTEMQVTLLEKPALNEDSITRAEVYEAIDSERDFQESVWNNRTEEGNNPSSWILWMEDYLQEARHLASRGSEAKGTKGRKMIMDMIRKVTAMGVACMEVNGAPKRDIFMTQRTQIEESKQKVE